MNGPDRPVPRGRVRRTMPLAGFTARATGGRVVAALREKAGDPTAVARFHERTAERYTELLGHSKGVLMKAGQMISMIDAGAVGAGELSPYQQALTRLQADAPPMHPDLAREVLEADLGQRTGEVFAEFSDEPMAAASIGQVHRAVLHDGREVAVKIQYPGVAAAIRNDLANSELLVTFSRFVGATLLDLREAAREIATRISEEVDYRHEADNIRAFSDLYREHPFIRIPDVVHGASGDRVLTMTFVEGWDWDAARRADQDLKDTWAEVISRMVTGSYRHANLFHADPHPGNYRFGLDGSVGFVDFGCVKRLSETQRRRIVVMARAAVDGRRDDLRATMVDSGFLATDSSLTADEAYQWWATVLHELLAPQPATYTPEAAERAIGSLIDLRAADHPVRRMQVPPDFVFFSRLNLSMNAVFTALNATIYARSLLDDMDGVAPPVTDLGKTHDAWVRQRGLPYGMDHHDTP
ncbi:AarF/ABC1/UbiB kinase family protein [Mycolicibacterium hippocampi]|uniref:Ubiquinone biosynthesis monooxygenase UbiB n=1 Tax=Mycolicibacterium hippocampi TaxID=659824 RepID=A0A850PLC7_9MYCO|nr:AarF/ABC1/UbiB kinase family protein [Mycolicibacterium hippocampi]NVN49353.1 Ubiquinone biosynthesis monooxygenase UbiB [Mycolicibacterium hippocampi]